MNYAAGWNAYLMGVPFDRNESVDWREGWSDCAASPPEDQQQL